MTTARSRITHAIFERECVVIGVPSTDYCDEAIVFKKLDRHIPKELKTRFKPGEKNKTSELLVEGISSPIDRRGFSEIYHKTLRAEAWQDADVCPGVKDLLYHLRYSEIPMALISHHASEEAAVHNEKYSKIESLFDVRIYRDDPELDSTNPDSDLFEVACRRFEDGTSPNKNVVAFARSPEFSTAALKAGLFVVWQMPSEETNVRRKASLAFQERSRVAFVNSLKNFHPTILGLAPLP